MESNAQFYVIAAVFAAVSLLLAALISSAIKYEGGANPSDPKKRKLWFWVMFVICFAGGFAFDFFVYYTPETNQFYKDEMMKPMCIATAVSAVLYIVIGVVLSKMFKTGKLGNWF